ncbi:MAG TPA: bifunctional 2-C-methyl-D-erythritol 4-phosphate cytidylyltransferase/2-C-methyl-D-erythritol 2,4-cyclodiphosphate synthase [Allosphingosinicella sp.]
MSERGRTIALMVAAGSGTRAGGTTPKQYAPIAGKALLAHALDHLSHPALDEVRVVIGTDQETAYREAIGTRGLPDPIAGAETRRQSARNGLEALSTQGNVDRVLIHDAARPFLPRSVLDRLLNGLDHHSGIVPVLPVVDSLALVEGGLGDAVTRDNLVRVQTPQAFRFADILAAHRAWPEGRDATDDAQIARAAGLDVATTPGDEMLEKITLAGDFARAEQRLASSLVSRTGLGFDVHALAHGEELWLGGLLIPHSTGLTGHSDADVVLHALTDAILGAIGAGDIGDHFPPSDPKWRGAASSQFVAHAVALVQAAGGRIDHVDLTIICEAPRIGPHREKMRTRIGGLLRLPVHRVSVKATTTERLGFTGRGEGIAAQAIVTVRLPEDQ